MQMENKIARRVRFNRSFSGTASDSNFNIGNRQFFSGICILDGHRSHDGQRIPHAMKNVKADPDRHHGDAQKPERNFCYFPHLKRLLGNILQKQ
jgi:hypothetical protein